MERAKRLYCVINRDGYWIVVSRDRKGYILRMVDELGCSAVHLAKSLGEVLELLSDYNLTASEVGDLNCAI
ncbi:MAG: hypothetical protein ACRCZ0_00180 [Cetobacterium sp.]